METRLQITGMTCAACVTRVEKILKRQPGVQSAQVNLATESALIRTESTADVAALVQAIHAAGYGAAPARPDAAEAPISFWPVAWGLALSLPLVIPMLGAAWGAHTMLPPWLQWLLATPVQFGLGGRFYRGAWKALRQKTGTMDQLVALGTTAAYALSVYLWLAQASPHLYFESAAVVITLVLLGKYLEARAKRKAADAVRALMALRPPTARVRRSEHGQNLEEDVAIEQITTGTCVVIRAGERVPIDATVIEGESHVDESMLTGEPMPVPKRPGEVVSGGTLNQDGLLVAQALRPADQSTLAGIIRAVERAQSAKAPIQHLVDQIAAIFVPAIVAIAAATFVGWLIVDPHHIETAVLNAVAVLVIACPCALGLATPAAIIAGTGAAARAGILVKDPTVFELARRIRAVAFDKTGTLTQGKPTVRTIVAAAGEDEAVLLSLAAALSAGSTHPLAQALIDCAHARAIAPASLGRIRTLPGKGVEAYDANGVWVALGQARWLASLGAPVPETATDHTTSWWARAAAPSDAPNGDRPAIRVLGRVEFTDVVRPYSAEGVARLHARGLTTVMLTGDQSATAHQIGREVGVQAVHGELTPEQKSEFLAGMKMTRGVVAMVGDGINDAPALAAADVSIAIGGGTDVALETAAITLMRPDLRMVSAAIEISARTQAKIRQNLFFAFAYNVVGIPLAALGWLSPSVAGLAMAMSSVSVVSNALLLARWRPRL